MLFLHTIMKDGEYVTINCRTLKIELMTNKEKINNALLKETATKLKQERKNKKVSLYKINKAEDIGIFSLMQFEKGISDVRLTSIFKICRQLGLDIRFVDENENTVIELDL